MLFSTANGLLPSRWLSSGRLGALLFGAMRRPGRAQAASASAALATGVDPRSVAKLLSNPTTAQLRCCPVVHPQARRATCSGGASQICGGAAIGRYPCKPGPCSGVCSRGMRPRHSQIIACRRDMFCGAPSLNRPAVSKGHWAGPAERDGLRARRACRLGLEFGLHVRAHGLRRRRHAPSTLLGLS